VVAGDHLDEVVEVESARVGRLERGGELRTGCERGDQVRETGDGCGLGIGRLGGGRVSRTAPAESASAANGWGPSGSGGSGGSSAGSSSRNSQGGGTGSEGSSSSTAFGTDVPIVLTSLGSPPISRST